VDNCDVSSLFHGCIFVLREYDRELIVCRLIGCRSSSGNRNSEYYKGPVARCFTWCRALVLRSLSVWRRKRWNQSPIGWIKRFLTQRIVVQRSVESSHADYMTFLREDGIVRQYFVRSCVWFNALKLDRSSDNQKPPGHFRSSGFASGGWYGTWTYAEPTL